MNELKQIQNAVQFPSPPYITSNQKVTLQGSSIIIDNVGDDDVYIDDVFLLPAGQSISFNSSQDYNVVSFSCWFRFANNGDNPRVQFAVIMPAVPGYGNYISK